MYLRQSYGVICASAVIYSLSVAASAAQTSPRLKLLNGEDRPPAQYLYGPTATGRTVERAFDSRKSLHAFCSEHLGAPAQGRFYACYVPAIDVVAVPSAKAWPDAAQREALTAHEWAHARGWRHPLRLVSRGQRTAAVR